MPPCRTGCGQLNNCSEKIFHKSYSSNETIKDKEEFLKKPKK